MASWNSVPLHISYEVLGWFAFICWSISFYPQVILNHRRKRRDGSCGPVLEKSSETLTIADATSRKQKFTVLLGLTVEIVTLLVVVGLHFDYAVLNMVKQACYIIYNVSLYFSSSVQKQYEDKYGHKQMIPVAANDVAFSAHAVLLCAVTLYQIAIYERGSQKVSKMALGVTLGVWLALAVCFFIALPHHNWLWLVSIFNDIQVILTIIKYIPQAVMNFMRKSTEGWSIGFILLDFSGGIANYVQMVMQSIDRGSWKNIYGNMGKLLLSLVTIFFDIIFLCQHYLLYPPKDTKSETPVGPDNTKSSEQPIPENDLGIV